MGIAEPSIVTVKQHAPLTWVSKNCIMFVDAHALDFWILGS